VLLVKARDAEYRVEMRDGDTMTGVSVVERSVSPIVGIQTSENMKRKYGKIMEHSRQHTRCARRPLRKKE
jgi:hypothetical protein